MTSSFPDYVPTTPNMLRHLKDSYGDLPQVIDATSQVSFNDVEAQSAQLARGLIARGVGKGSRVGILLPNGPSWVVAWFAVTRIGAVAVQLSTFAKPREISHVLRHADVSLLIVGDRYLSHDYLERMEAALDGLKSADGRRPLRLVQAPHLREIWVFGAAPVWAKGDRAALEAQAEEGEVSPELLAAIEAEVHPADMAIMIYTSGSTSEPKSVVHSQGALVRHAHVMSTYTTYQRGDRLISTSPLFWVGGLCTSLFTANHRGAALIVPPSQAPEDVVRMMREKGATHTTLMGAKVRGLLGAAGFSDEEFYRLKPITSQYLATFGHASKEETPDALGMSETFGPHSMEHYAPVPKELAGSYGRQVMDIERKIVDPATGETLPVGQKGELCVRGYSLMDGYYKKERSEAFDKDGWFHTGDLCSLNEDGHLFFHGRQTEMLKSSGANVAPREVELVMMEYPAIREVAVVGVPDAKLGQKVVAFVVPADGAEIDEAALRAWLHEQLSSYKVPKQFVFMSPLDMPRTNSGKVHKPSLREMLEKAQ
jgi:acyl-CoA synthetase (AMP-forming)/AMP-acid ligase II